MVRLLPLAGSDTGFTISSAALIAEKTKLVPPASRVKTISVRLFNSIDRSAVNELLVRMLQRNNQYVKDTCCRYDEPEMNSNIGNCTGNGGNERTANNGGNHQSR